jgi:hypothetical protein
MLAFRTLKVFILFGACLALSELLMIYGYATYLPQFPYDILSGSYYEDIMGSQFSGLGIASALLVFYLSRFFLLSYKTSLITFLLSGVVFNFFAGEGHQYHWRDGYIYLSSHYFICGLFILLLLNFMKKIE